MTHAQLAAHQKLADAAFDKALASGRLSFTVGADNYVGDHMWMGTDPNGKDHFKHRMTRRYLP